MPACAAVLVVDPKPSILPTNGFFGTPGDASGRGELQLKVLALVGAFVCLPLAVLLAAQLGDDDLRETSTALADSLTSPTPRTVTDERQARITAEVVPGPEVAAGAARGTITGVAANLDVALYLSLGFCN